MGFQGFERWDRMRFNTNVLKTVVCQVRFSHSFAIEEPSSIAGLQKALRDRYPDAMPRQELLFGLSIPGAQASEVRTPSIYRFRDASGVWVVSLSPDWVGLETTEYTNFEEFRERLEEVIRLVEELFAPAQVDRVGFRYVNELPCGAKGDWRELVQPELHGLAADDSVLDHLVDSAEELHLILGQNKMNVRHGMAMEGDKHCYTFDIDAFSEARGSFSTKQIVTTVDELKAQAWSFFRASVTDELLSQLGTKSVP
jgi:uncharacterized protein (TIGR04255 family)